MLPDEATIAGLKSGSTTCTDLPEDRIAQLFSTHGLTFGRLQGAGSDAQSLHLPSDEADRR
jgi:hypothetical protein